MGDQDRYLLVRWRVGSRVGRTIYADVPGLAHDDHPLIGVMDTAALAGRVVHDHNWMIAGTGDYQ
jgi:hypothetical protein